MQDKIEMLTEMLAKTKEGAERDQGKGRERPRKGQRETKKISRKLIGKLEICMICILYISYFPVPRVSPLMMSYFPYQFLS